MTADRPVGDMSDEEFDGWLASRYAAFVDDLTATLDLVAGVDDATQARHFTALVADLGGVLDLDAGLQAIVSRSARPVPVLPSPPRRPVEWLPVTALVVLTAVVSIFPHQGVLSLVLFGVAPIALLVKWTFEAYAGSELERECTVLDQRAQRFTLLRRRLDRAADTVAATRAHSGGGHPSRDDHLDEALTRLRSAAATLDVLADLVERTSKASRAFATNWPDAPVESFSVHRQNTADIAPDQVRRTVVIALGQLRGLASMDIDVRTARAVSGAADTTSRVHTIGAEVEAIVHEVALSQTTLDRELTRLERAFDTVHHSAATHVIKTRIPIGAVRVAALIGLNLNVSTLSRARRTPARAVFVQEARMTPDTTLRTIHRAAVAMRTAA
jgi:hypothetical protein